ncbi:MAG: family 20 glycosylhydrolase [Salinibacter sp.]
MRILSSVSSWCCLLLLLGAAGLRGPAQAQSPPSAENLAVEWGVITNLVDDGARFRSRLTLTNNGETTLPAAGWTLYFNFIRPIDSTSVTGGVEITRINGDFYRLTPGDDFAALPPGAERSITFEAPGSAIKHIDAPAGFYIVSDGAAPASLPDVSVTPFTRPEQTTRGPNDVLPTPTPGRRYRANRALSPRPADSVGRIVPTPASTTRRPGTFTLPATPTIRYESGLESEARRLAEGLEAAVGPATTTTTADAPAITLRRADVRAPTADTVHAEAYRLRVDPDGGIEIVGTTAAGVFYGTQSLQAWLPVSAYGAGRGPVSVPAVTIADAPRFGYRGLHLDVARNFQSTAAVKRLLDVMAFYKLNTFHFHLTDDEGWRLAIDGLPALTEVGGRRGHTLDERTHLVPSYGSGPDPAPDSSRGSGWYTPAEYREILRYARDRHIEVVPEIDMPGHARAAIQAMKARTRRLLANGDTTAARRFRLHDPDDQSEYESVQGWDDNVVNVCQPSTYRFLAHVVDELRALHERAGAPLRTVHVGGDEVPSGAWTESPICDDYIARTEGVEGPEDLFGDFVRRFRDTLATRGLTMGGWEEVGMTEAGGHRATTTTPNTELVGKGVRPYVWSNIWGGGTEDRAYRLANAGFDVVMSQATNFYLDMAYSKHPQEDGFYWAGFVDLQDPFAFVPLDLYKSADRTSMGRPINPDSAFADHVRLADSARSNILGLQGQLWGETLRSVDRMEYMAVPRLLSLAERAWAPQPRWATLEDVGRLREQRAAAWSAFAHRLGRRELPRLSRRAPEWTYRLPPPGATVENDTLRANAALPGLPIRYTTDGTTPTSTSPRYRGPVAVAPDAPVRLRTFDGRGRGSRTVVVRP